jgi:hypothetical protein
VTETEHLNFEAVITTLAAWVGEPIYVLVGPRTPPDHGPGMVWARMAGILAASEEGAVWSATGPDDPDRTGIAFQVGARSDNYFVLYRELFERAWWVSSLRRFFIVEMRTVEIGISLE